MFVYLFNVTRIQNNKQGRKIEQLKVHVLKITGEAKFFIVCVYGGGGGGQKKCYFFWLNDHWLKYRKTSFKLPGNTSLRNCFKS